MTLLPEETIKITDNLEVKWYAEHRIVGYKVTTLDKDIMETWQGVILEIAKEWQKNRPYLALHDLSEPGVGSSLWVINKLHDSWRTDFIDLITPYVTAPIRVAIVYAPTASGNLAKISAEIQTFDLINIKTFYEQNHALDWLYDGVDNSH